MVYFIAYRRQMYPKFAVKGLLSAIDRLDTFIKSETDPSKKNIHVEWLFPSSRTFEFLRKSMEMLSGL